MARAKSFAVPAGMTASGTPRRPASSATGPMVPSPPATAIRSGRQAATRSNSSASQPATSTSASIASTSGAGSRPPPAARLATSAIRTAAEGSRPYFFFVFFTLTVAVLEAAPCWPLALTATVLYLYVWPALIFLSVNDLLFTESVLTSL